METTKVTMKNNHLSCINSATNGFGTKVGCFAGVLIINGVFLRTDFVSANFEIGGFQRGAHGNHVAC